MSPDTPTNRGKATKATSKARSTGASGGSGTTAKGGSARQRRRGPRKVTVGLAVLLALLALVVGVAVGILAGGGDDAAPLQTVEREVRVVTAVPGR